MKQEDMSLSRPTGRLSIWHAAIRPRTLSLAVTPVIAGTWLAGLEVTHMAWDAFVVALIVASLIQIGTNLHNDAADFERGGDQPDRLGPVRVTAAGWLSAEDVHKAARLSFALAILGGGYLVWLYGWPIALLGLASLIAGYLYSGGPKPISYTPLGEVFVFLFFGLVAFVGSYYLQTRSVSDGAMILGAVFGLQAAAVLMVNNYRDFDADRAVGRRTLAICAGRPLSRFIYALLMLAPFALLLPLQMYVPLLGLPVAFYLIVRFWLEQPGEKFNILLGRTAQMQVLFAALLCTGFYL